MKATPPAKVLPTVLTDDIFIPGSGFELLNRVDARPNEIWHSKAQSIGFAAIKRSLRGTDFALNEKALSRVVAGLKDGIVAEAFIVSMEFTPDYRRSILCQRPAVEVAAMLAKVPPWPGQFGPYYWLTQQLTLPQQAPGLARATSDDAPF